MYIIKCLYYQISRYSFCLCKVAFKGSKKGYLDHKCNTFQGHRMREK